VEVFVRSALLICAISVGAGHGKGIRFRLMTRPRHAERRIFAAQSQGLTPISQSAICCFNRQRIASQNSAQS
jgi:hypothetical protein